MVLWSLPLIIMNEYAAPHFSARFFEYRTGMILSSEATNTSSGTVMKGALDNESKRCLRIRFTGRNGKIDFPTLTRLSYGETRITALDFLV